MTNLNREIGLFEQFKFIINKPDSMRLLLAYSEGNKCGYLVLTEKKDGAYITEVVDEKYRVLGVATKMIDYAKQLHDVIIADILNNNEASLRVHIKNGFNLHTRGDVFSRYVFNGVNK